MNSPSLADIQSLLSAPDPDVVRLAVTEGWIWSDAFSADTVRMGIACALGEVSVVRRLIEANPARLELPCSCPSLSEMVGLESPNDLPPENFSPLMVACFFGHPALVHFLLESGADPEQKRLSIEEWNAPLAASTLLLENWKGGGWRTPEAVAIFGALLDHGARFFLPEPGRGGWSNSVFSMFVYGMNPRSRRPRKDPGKDLCEHSQKALLEGWAALLSHPQIQAQSGLWSAGADSFGHLKREIQQLADVDEVLPWGIDGRGMTTVLGFVVDHLLEAGFSRILVDGVMTPAIQAVFDQRHLSGCLPPASQDGPPEMSPGPRLRL
jgi:hypothetical protein